MKFLLIFLASICILGLSFLGLSIKIFLKKNNKSLKICGNNKYLNQKKCCLNI